MSDSSSSSSSHPASKSSLLLELQRLQKEVGRLAWADISDDLPEESSSLYDAPRSSAASAALTKPPASVLSALTSVPSGNIRSGKNKKKRKGEYHVIFGNDTRYPWMKPMKDKTEILICGQFNGQITATSTVAETYTGLFFTVSSLDNFASLASVFDEYYIVQIEVCIVPPVTEITAAGSTAGVYVSAVDIDDGTAPSSFNQVASYAGSLQSNGTSNHYHRWKPMFSVATYSGAFTSYSSSEGWVDCASPNVQHFGMKVAWTSVSASTIPAYLCKMWVRFRGLH